MKNNIILIGMPGCGKSTTGVVLAKTMGYDFLDCDLLIQNEKGKKLAEIIAENGTEGFNRIEEEVNCSIDVSNTVISTGGSAVYGHRAMTHFRKNGYIVFLKVKCEELERRLGSLEERGVSIKEGQTLEDLFEERRPLYEKYADIVIEPEGLDVAKTMEMIKKAVEEKMKAEETDV